MKLPLLTIIKSRIKESEYCMEVFYAQYQISRQAYHQAMYRKGLLDTMMLEIKDKVRSYRSSKDRRAGSRSLYHNLGVKTLYGIGVTKFERLMSAHGMRLRYIIF